jgi:hypothetical protein
MPITLREPAGPEPAAWSLTAGMRRLNLGAIDGGRLLPPVLVRRGGVVDTGDGVGMQAASAGPVRSIGRARLAAGKTGGVGGQVAESIASPAIGLVVIGRPTRRAGLNACGHIGVGLIERGAGTAVARAAVRGPGSWPGKEE